MLIYRMYQCEKPGGKHATDAAADPYPCCSYPIVQSACEVDQLPDWDVEMQIVGRAGRRGERLVMGPLAGHRVWPGVSCQVAVVFFPLVESTRYQSGLMSN